MEVQVFHTQTKGRFFHGELIINVESTTTDTDATRRKAWGKNKTYAIMHTISLKSCTRASQYMEKS